MVYDPYEHVPISYGVVTFFDSCRLLWIVMIFQKNLLSFSSLSLVYDPYEHVLISYGVGDVFAIVRIVTVTMQHMLGIWVVRVTGNLGCNR